ncbi:MULTISPECIES: hypothetical protein [Streptomyces]|nr:MULTISPECIES: hypothetical protein [Streptomyces]MBZ6083419.1 hypothetical protein [Streptomyces olivaceus]MBZ6111005.1 hypothetical protein [Streptomyces olivaceus]MBZ6126372.1 hypothetical protein [Streptomyces olivaceus]MBZ6145342.1 hypothetical protein [Streptomyces olivaceus]MBZ6159652.1 hypothetical protein [Streptomyces olivaceus]
MSEVERVAEALAAGAATGLTETVRRVVRDVSARLLTLPGRHRPAADDAPSDADEGASADDGAGAEEGAGAHEGTGAGADEGEGERGGQAPVGGRAATAGSGPAATYHVVATGARGVLVGDHAVQHNTFN